jgi:ATP-binding cassette subfamily F protein 3
MRVLLAKMILQQPDLLLLDEPTNHLDIHSVELLIEALNRYEGSLILVSHDRYFISRVANTIWEIDNYEIKDFDGGYEEFVEWKERKAANLKAEAGNAKAGNSNAPAAPAAQKPENTPTPKAAAPVVKPVAPEPKPQAPAPINKEAKKELQKQQRIFQQLEEKIAQLNEQKVKLEAELTAPDTYANRNKFVEVETNYKKVSNELVQANKQYEQVFEKIMELEAKQ